MKQQAQKILVVDDEPDIREFLSYNLKKEGYEVFEAQNGLEAIKQVKEIHPDLVLLDVMMPKLDGIAVCRELRSGTEFSHVLIAFLTALGDEESEIRGLACGADDYIPKPIKPRLLLSRVRALLRRNLPVFTENIITAGEVEIDRERYSVKYKNQVQTLPKKEFELLVLLASQPGKVFTREEIMDKVWGTDVIVGDRTIDVHIRKLRQKLGEETITTLKGIGYKLEAA